MEIVVSPSASESVPIATQVEVADTRKAFIDRGISPTESSIIKINELLGAMRTSLIVAALLGPVRWPSLDHDYRDGGEKGTRLISGQKLGPCSPSHAIFLPGFIPLLREAFPEPEPAIAIGDRHGL